MTAKLCNQVALNFCDADKKKLFFKESMRARLSAFERFEQSNFRNVQFGCKTYLYFGFFFDGTKNNYTLAEKNKNHAKIARLYHCYPRISVPGILMAKTDWEYYPPRYTHFLRTYIPGVASPFKNVNDSGEGLAQTFGERAFLGYDPGEA